MTTYNTIPDKDWDALRRDADRHGESTVGEHISSPGLTSGSQPIPADKADRN